MGGDSGTYCAGMPCCCSLRSTKRFKRPHDAPPAAGPAAAAVPLDAAAHCSASELECLVFVQHSLYLPHTKRLSDVCDSGHPGAHPVRAAKTDPLYVCALCGSSALRFRLGLRLWE